MIQFSTAALQMMILIFLLKNLIFTVECLEEFSCKKIVVLVDVEFKICNHLVKARRN